MGEPLRRVLGDRYELCELLATGGMGRVWRAHDRLLGRTVAVKLLRSEYTDDAVSLARFRAEAQVSARLVHRNIAALHDYGEATAPDGEVSAYLVMELVEGESLADRLAREPRPPLEVVLDVVDQTAAALAAAHAAGVVHRDVKPGNVLLGADGVVRITDFGIAWTSTSAPLTRTGQVVGTACYLSPEQAEGRQATPASDVYALGMVAYECLAGGRAFDGDNPVQIALRQIRESPAPLPDDVPANVRRLVDRALVKDPEQRLPDGAAVRAAVADVRAGRRIAPVPTPPTRVLSLPAPRPRRRVLAPLVALLAGVGLGVGLLQLTTGAQSVLPPAAAADEAADEVAGGPAQEAEAGVEVSAGEFVGRPADEVQAELVVRGLLVARVTEVTAAVAPGLVTAVGPVGVLPPGTLVTVTVAAAPAPAPGTPAPGTAGVETRAAVPVAPAPEPAPVVPSTGGGAAGGGTAGGGTTGAAGGGPAAGGGNGAGNAGGNGAGGNGAGNGNGGGNAAGNGNAGGNGNGNGNGNGRG